MKSCTYPPCIFYWGKICLQRKAQILRVCMIQWFLANVYTQINKKPLRSRTFPSPQRVSVWLFAINSQASLTATVPISITYISFAYDWASYQWNHTVGTLLCLLSLSIMFLRFFHVIAKPAKLYSVVWMNIQKLVCPFFCWTFELFPVWALMNRASMDIHMHTSFYGQIGEMFPFLPREIARSRTDMS